MTYHVHNLSISGPGVNVRTPLDHAFDKQSPIVSVNNLDQAVGILLDTIDSQIKLLSEHRKRIRAICTHGNTETSSVGFRCLTCGYSDSVV